jgi:hypothetical protein
MADPAGFSEGIVMSSSHLDDPWPVQFTEDFRFTGDLK